MTIVALAILGIWFLAVLDMASEKDSFWHRIIREAKRRSRAMNQ